MGREKVCLGIRKKNKRAGLETRYMVEEEQGRGRGLGSGVAQETFPPPEAVIIRAL